MLTIRSGAEWRAWATAERKRIGSVLAEGMAFLAKTNRSQRAQTFAYVGRPAIREAESSRRWRSEFRMFATVSNINDGFAKPRLVVANISRAFGGDKAVADVSLSLAPGTVMGLIGPNGSGKTTLMNLINGLLRADSGTVRLDAGVLDNLSPSRRAALGLSRTFQAARVFNSLSVRQNLYVPLLHDTASARHAAAEWLDELLELTGLMSVADRQAGALSGGQQKLVEFARAMTRRPRLVLMDEPFAGVHHSVVDTLSEAVRSFTRSGCSFLIASHELPILIALADTITAMAAGRAIVSGRPYDVARDERVIETYLGIP